ncbi:MAG: hypothetical protein QM730_02320 [Anaerolineales bacterium]
MMKLKGSSIALLLVWCLFMGVTAISIGFGAVFPSMNRITKPFICPNGEMELETQTYRPYPGNTTTTITWYCVDASGNRKELGIFPMALYAGFIYGFLLFLVIYLFLYIRSLRTPSTASPTSYDRLAEANASLERAKQYHADAEQFRKQAEQFRERAEQSNDPRFIFGQQLEEESTSQGTLERMKELKKLRDENLISETEYDEKRKEILKKL